MKKYKERLNNNLKIKCAGMNIITRIMIAISMGILLAFGSFYFILSSLIIKKTKEINSGFETELIKPLDFTHANDSINIIDYTEYGQTEK